MIKEFAIPDDLTIDSWESLEGYFSELLNRNISNKNDLVAWLKDRSSLEAILQEDLGWRYIKQTTDTQNLEFKKDLEFFINEIEPNLSEINNKLNKKLLECPFKDELKERKYFVFLRGVSEEVKLFRKENIPLQTELQLLSNQYGSITGKMTIEVNGEELTFQKAANFLKSEDRNLRRDVYEKINMRRTQDRDELESLFDKMIALRHQIALNAGFDNYRDYMFAAMGRFDYTPKDCFDFHESIEKLIVHIVDEYNQLRKDKLEYEALYPWDSEVDIEKKPALSPFTDSDDLIAKTIACFNKIKPEFGKVIELMNEKGHLDLDSRIGKAPGGYNYPLYKSSLPFIFMHATGSLRDMITMMHEGGHAVHSWLSRDLEINSFKDMPSEIAEVASMAMELISMEHWDEFFESNEELQRAKKYQLEKILTILPWIACIDAFQHWIYTNPKHTREERKEYWKNLSKRFSGVVMDRTLYPEFESYSWHRQLHLFEVPFYYIEYGIAQLGAMGIWKNYTENADLALKQYEQALSEGYTFTLPELYDHAGIKFDFSPEYLSNLISFVTKEAKDIKS